MNNPITQEELDTIEAVTVAEMLRFCLSIIARDLENLAGCTHSVALMPPEEQADFTMQIAHMAGRIAARATDMLEGTDQLMAVVALKEAEARQRRVGEVGRIH